MDTKIQVWDVQTIYGTRAKTFQRKHHAEDYMRQLAKEYDRELIEIHKRNLTTEDFIYENLED